MKLALGPLQYYWTKERVFRFYREAADLPVDIVYLGETVCARRHELREEDWLFIAAQLDAAGKEVVLSTQVLLESGAHLQAMHRIVENGRYPIEANDMGAVGLLENKVPFVAGPHLNLYHPAALNFVVGLGAFRWVMPLEMSRDDLTLMQKALPDTLQTEVFAHGRLPLAFSARCFTARYHNLQKDQCGFKCLDYPDGLPVQTREKRPFLVFNGVQTQSAGVYNLIAEVPTMRKMGVDVLRLAPQSAHMGDVAALFADVIADRLSSVEGLNKMKDLMQDGMCNGYWYGEPGMKWIETTRFADVGR